MLGFTKLIITVLLTIHLLQCSQIQVQNQTIIPITDLPYGLDDFMCSIMMFILGQKERNAEI